MWLYIHKGVITMKGALMIGRFTIYLHWDILPERTFGFLLHNSSRLRAGFEKNPEIDGDRKTAWNIGLKRLVQPIQPSSISRRTSQPMT